MWSDIRYVDFEGHRLSFREAGSGPALIVLNLYRRRAALIDPEAFADRFRMVQMAPLGFGYSDRVPGYAGERLARQVLAVLGDDRDFVVWGYSAGGAMALTIAQQTTRCAGVVCGGLAPIDFPTPGAMRQMDRRLDPEAPSRSLWWWFTTFDWAEELASMSARQLFYWGSEDRQVARRLRRASELLPLQEADFIELHGHDHAGANQPSVVASEVAPAVSAWLATRLDSAW